MRFIIEFHSTPATEPEEIPSIVKVAGELLEEPGAFDVTMDAGALYWEDEPVAFATWRWEE